MVHVTIVVAFIIILLSDFLQLRVESQSTIDTLGDNSCPQSEEERRMQTDEIHRLQLELENERQRVKTLENISRSQSEEIERLKVKLENEERLVQPCQRQVTVKLVERLRMSTANIYRVTKVKDEIYVLCHLSNVTNSIKVYEDRNEFRLLREIALTGTKWPYDMVYSNESKCFYITEGIEKCIWRMTTGGDHRLTKWLTNVTWPYTLSLSNEGHLLLVRQGLPFSQLEIYSLNANLIRSIQLPSDMKHPRHVVQTSAGYYVILHVLSNEWNGSLVISQVNSSGQLINRFTPINQFQKLNDAWQLFIDSDNNRLIVADNNNHRVILFDSNCLTWNQILLSEEKDGIGYPWSVFYDAIKRQLLLRQSRMLDVYELT